MSIYDAVSIHTVPFFIYWSIQIMWLKESKKKYCKRALLFFFTKGLEKVFKGFKVSCLRVLIGSCTKFDGGFWKVFWVKASVLFMNEKFFEARFHERICVHKSLLIKIRLRTCQSRIEYDQNISQIPISMSSSKEIAFLSKASQNVYINSFEEKTAWILECEYKSSKLEMFTFFSIVAKMHNTFSKTTSGKKVC